MSNLIQEGSSSFSASTVSEAIVSCPFDDLVNEMNLTDIDSDDDVDFEDDIDSEGNETRDFHSEILAIMDKYFGKPDNTGIFPLSSKVSQATPKPHDATDMCGDNVQAVKNADLNIGDTNLISGDTDLKAIKKEKQKQFLLQQQKRLLGPRKMTVQSPLKDIETQNPVQNAELSQDQVA